ncbi:MAG: cyclic nucleotide-binding domain-containing protein [Bradymonadales bacterium]|nr:cyclic nucleotide-binding domain-containing protein [Bradymonadales bacterium]
MNMVTVNPIEFFKEISLFAGLDESEILELLREAEQVFYPAGHSFFEQGADPDGLYVIERGEVSVRIKAGDGPEILLAHLGNGSVIGEMALIDGGPRSATVTALSPIEGYFLSKEKIEEMRTNRPSYAYKIILQLARTLNERRQILEHQIKRLREEPERRPHVWGDPTRELIARVRKG